MVKSWRECLADKNPTESKHKILKNKLDRNDLSINVILNKKVVNKINFRQCLVDMKSAIFTGQVGIYHQLNEFAVVTLHCLQKLKNNFNRD